MNPSEALPAMQRGGFDRAVLETTDTGSARREVFENYKLVKAGGGVVRNTGGEMLIIFRRNHWDLPKGHLEDNETLPECALREVTEETGLKHLHIIHKTTVTYHVYKEDGKDILKETHWYFMDNYQNEQLHLQSEEDIEKAEWVHFNDMGNYFDKMYPSVRDVLQPLATNYLRS